MENRQSNLAMQENSEQLGYNFVRNVPPPARTGASSAGQYKTAGNDTDEILKKLRKLEVLAASDKETIEAQQKKMTAMR